MPVTRNIHPVEYAAEQLQALMPHPAKDANKYSRGKLMLVAGSAAYPGAACLAAFGAQRAGAGYVQVLCAEEGVGVVRGYRPSLVAASWNDLRVVDWPESTAAKPCACAVGPGFEVADARQAHMALRIVRDARMPVLVDGGALAALASAEGLAAACERASGEPAARVSAARCLAADAAGSEAGHSVGADAGAPEVSASAAFSVSPSSAFPLVITPHGGEAARLLKAARLDEDARSRRWEPERMAFELARAYRCVAVLKGPDTFVSDGATVAAVRLGTPALAKAGTGDVLAGIIGALLAQGVSAVDAAVLGATLHAEAGRAAAAQLTEIAVTPEDVIDFLPAAIRAVG